MKKTLVYLLISALFFISSCDCGSSNYNPDNNINPDNNDNPDNNTTDITGYGTDPSLPYTEQKLHEYYLDAISGNDITGDGSGGSPWQTLDKAKSVMVSGDTIYLRNGNYGTFSETTATARTGWITFKADTGANPVLTGININYSAISGAYLRFDGIEVQSPGGSGINLDDTRNVEIRNCTIHHETDNKYLVDNGIRMAGTACDNILIYHNHIHSAMRGISALNTQNVSISANHIHGLGGGTGIQYAGDCANFILEKNNIYDSNHNPADPDAPADPHGSAVSIRSNDIWIRENIFHNMGSSSGIMFYTPDAAGGEEVYSNIIIENNLFYDILTGGILRIYNLGSDIIVRNNTIIGHVRTDVTFGADKLYDIFSVHTLAAGYDGSGISVYNNIIAGTASLPRLAAISNNIFWAFRFSQEDRVFQSALAGNIIVTYNSSYPIDYFTSGFFTGIDSEDDLAAGHGLFLDFTLAAGSDAVNYGDPENQPERSLGTINVNGYLQDDGALRDSSNHSAGCYE